MLVPVKTDVAMERWPIANFALLGVTVAAFVGMASEAIPVRVLRHMILDGWRPIGLVGHVLLHAGPWHLLGNMVFLWVFGNAVCAKLGNGLYPAVYAGLGVAAGATHVIADGGLAVGASGAINGVVGMYLVLYPLAEITCMFILFIRPRFFSVASFWMILLWLGFDIWGAWSGTGDVAYWAHLGGFFGGAGLAVGLLLTGLVRMSEGERSLLEILGFRLPARRPGLEDEEDAPAGRPETLAERERRLLARVKASTSLQAAPPPMSAAPTPPPASSSQATATPPSAAAPIMLRCPCGRGLRVARSLAGRRVRCPGCSAAFRVPHVP